MKLQYWNNPMTIQTKHPLTFTKASEDEPCRMILTRNSPSNFKFALTRNSSNNLPWTTFHQKPLSLPHRSQRTRALIGRKDLHPRAKIQTSLITASKPNTRRFLPEADHE